MNKFFKAFIAFVTFVFLSVPSFAAPIELHYWHGHTGKLENIINEIANRWNAKQDESKLIPTSKGSYEDILAAFIAAYRAVNILIWFKSMMQVRQSWLHRLKMELYIRLKIWQLSMV